MDTNALVSVILCTYNRKEQVLRAVDSVLKQTYANWQLIIVDDGSTDGSEKVLSALTKKDRRIVSLRQSNKGVAQARNVGLKNASGRYISFIDSDDEYKQDHLEQRIAYLESHKKVAAIYGGIIIIGPKKKHYVPDVNHPGKKIHIAKCHPVGTLVARRHCLLAVKGFRDIPYSEDYDLIKRLKKSFMVVRVDFPTYIYRVDSKNRLSDLFEAGGENGILKFRKGLRDE